MNTAISTLLTLLQAIIPAINNTGTVGKIIEALIAWLPIIIKEANALLPIVKNIILTVQGNPASTADQIAALEALNKDCDEAFDAAAAAAIAEDAAD